MRSILYRFPDLQQFERMVFTVDEPELELGLPQGEEVEDGEWVLAIFELGVGRRATSAAARACVAPDGSRLVFEPRDWQRLADFAKSEAHRDVSVPPPSPAPPRDSDPPDTARSVAAPAVETRALETRPPKSGARVLVVDDDPDIRELVSAMLEAVGLSVATVGAAEDALVRVAEEAFDLMVLDWNLPKMSGLDLCRALRREPASARVPVLFLTANASSQDMVDAFACGADDYVVKPFRAPELGARIFSLLRRARR
jgi:two-component system phosphate regulon response regulator PhoB